MILVYRLLVNLVIVLSPIILLFRFIKKKEDKIRFKEKFTIFSKKRKKGKLIWLHTVSVGEMLSIVPLVKKFEKNKNINQILITSSTLSSAKLFTKFHFKKTIHQFFPIDSNFFTKRFLKYWRPKIAIFVDSEIWPNMLINLNKMSTNKILLNARISKRSFKRWRLLGSFSKNLFQKFDYIFPQNAETKKYLEMFKVKKIKLLGNLKFSQNRDFIKNSNAKFRNFIKDKKIWCAASTHPGEEKICGVTHLKLLKKFKNLITIIIPRHTHRLDEILNDLKKLNIHTHTHSSKKKIDKKTQIYIVDTYGETKVFFNKCKIVFLGKSLTADGGQNPLEPARFNCQIIHGPNVSNFTELYKLLNQQKIAFKINSQNGLYSKVLELFNKKSRLKKTKNNINTLGDKILKRTTREIKAFI